MIRIYIYPPASVSTSETAPVKEETPLSRQHSNTFPEVDREDAMDHGEAQAGVSPKREDSSSGTGKETVKEGRERPPHGYVGLVKEDSKAQKAVIRTVKPSKHPKLFPSLTLSSSSSKPKKRCTQQMKLADSFARAPPPSDASHPIVIDDETFEGSSGSRAVQKGKTPGPGVVGRKPYKRKSGDICTSREGEPIPKSLKTHKKIRPVSCPVCSKEFTDISNFDLNRHLDTCLGTTAQHAC